jgi:hypothetical protein
MMAHVESGHNVNVHHRDRSARSAYGSVGLPIKRDLSSDFYDHLALCGPLLDVGQSFRGRLEWKYPIYNGTNSTGFDEGAELA